MKTILITGANSGIGKALAFLTTKKQLDIFLQPANKPVHQHNQGTKNSLIKRGTYAYN